MSKYDEWVEKLARRKYHDYMGGAMFPRAHGLDTAAEVLGVQYYRMAKAVDKRFKELLVITKHGTKALP